MLEYVVFVSKRVCDPGGYLRLQEIQINHGIHFNALFNENERGLLSIASHTRPHHARRRFLSFTNYPDVGRDVFNIIGQYSLILAVVSPLNVPNLLVRPDDRASRASREKLFSS